MDSSGLPEKSPAAMVKNGGAAVEDRGSVAADDGDWRRHVDIKLADSKTCGACAVSSGLRLWRGRRLRLHLDEGNAVAALHARDSQWLGSYGRFTKTTKTKLKNAWSYGAYLWWRSVVMNSAWLQGAVASTIFGDGSAPTKVPHSFLLTFSFFFLTYDYFFCCREWSGECGYLKKYVELFGLGLDLDFLGQKLGLVITSSTFMIYFQAIFLVLCIFFLFKLS